MSSSFPSLLIQRDRLVPQGDFAVAQAAFLRPSGVMVRALYEQLAARNAGIVAHFYMDAELQGVLTACEWPHIHIADSLAMADRAVKMAEAGVKTVLVLGVDFMSENVRAVLDHAGHADVDVLRVAVDPIGCSLAESAERPAYEDWLRRAGRTPRSLHVVYINTSLVTKARAQVIVPTITCTSSNVVKTLLQADAQLPGVHLWYGPDTYMGDNLVTLLTQLGELPDAAVQSIHPAHTAASVRALVTRLHTFRHGHCVVHHLFGDDVVRRVASEHPDALVTAHLEVPGEMFALGARAQAAGRGVVGSTSDILGFILRQVDAALRIDGPQRLPVVLGTESGMITSIVNAVQRALSDAGRDDVSVEIIFPVAGEAVTVAPGSGLAILPGVAAGEGCSVAGGCATCPFMKMNTLHATLDLLEQLGRAGADVSGYRPRDYTEPVGGRPAAEVGGEPILAMRHFQRTGALPNALVALVAAGQP